MAPSEDDVIVGLCSRVSSARPDRDVFYHYDHCSKWPQGALKGLLKCRLMMPAPDADWIVCRKCEHKCNRPVEHASSAEPRAAPRSQITCELRDDVSVIPIRAERLRRWRTNQRFVSAFVAQQLGLRIRTSDYKVGRVIFQGKRFEGVRATLSLEFSDRRTVIRFGGSHQLGLEELIVWKHGVPGIDFAEIAAWVGEGYSGGKSYQKSSLGRARQKRNYGDRNDEWQRIANSNKPKRPALGKVDIAM